MNPQSWLDAFVQRNVVDLARMREYCEQGLAQAMVPERKKRPRPTSIQGAVVAMDMRDRVLLAAENPVFQSGRFRLVPRPNRSVCLVEKATGIEVRVRKIHESPALDRSIYTKPDVHQPMIFDPAGDTLGPGLTPVLVWCIDQSDLLSDFRAVIVDNLDELQRSPMVVCASAEVPPLATLKGVVGTAASSAPKDDFDDLVEPRRPLRADGTGDAPPQA
ncbi:hypothetical protein J7E88_18030 [Streptomyces sp. ISL-10]|uniref:hypothetical protein n=1 Tax=Streptomyces sp. ISL-10 TaxID=2819172 RepID=UPI001BEBC26C|nr:hypothetical protein [Streptomyces sp. ISL-10]MBT2367155.1 hypothetical protein [Streptomyces sp. ISL-10]